MTHEYTEPDLTPADAKRLRAFLTSPAERLTPAEEVRQRLNGPGNAQLALLCAVHTGLHQDGAMLARVAPWLLTARLVTR